MITARWGPRVAIMLAAASTIGVVCAEDESLEDNTCVMCHGNSDLWEGDTAHLLVTADDLAGDIHWQKGIRCQDCHGGDPTSFDLRQTHAIEDGFRKVESPADLPKFCGHCHSDPQAMEPFDKGEFQDSVAEYFQGVHGKHLQEVGGENAATCTSCHPTHQMRAVSDPLSAVHPRNLTQTCGACHVEQRMGMSMGVHHYSGERDEFDRGTPLDCSICHGQNAHTMLSVDDAQSPVYLDNQVALCGECHQDYLASYEASAHGTGLRDSGLLVTAVCSDCHGAHAIYYAADRRSKLHSTNVADTCGACHHFIEERLKQSVHGGGAGPGREAERLAPGSNRTRNPGCVDCHQGHEAPHRNSSDFSLEIPNRCGNCHAQMSSSYHLSVHGQLTQLGYAPAAECSDCHGAHDILPVSNPKSTLAPGNRRETCMQCHPFVVQNFTNFDPHADASDGRNYPVLHGFYTWISRIIYVLFAFFFIHAALWFVRSLVSTMVRGQDRVLIAARQGAVLRFGPPHRLTYIVLIICFLGLALTGLPLKYGYQPWGRQMAQAMGGFQTTSVWHHFFAAAALFCGCAHLFWAASRIIRLRAEERSWKSLVFGPDSPVPTRRDIQDLGKMAKWFVGLGNKPGFERWAYWEKFDYWGVYVAFAVVGLSGLMLWFPNVFTRFLPGTVLNVAQTIHANLALVAGGIIFAIHVFNTHFRPEKFPLDTTPFTGLVREDHLDRARPEFVQRLQEEGTWDELHREVPARIRLWPAVLGGGLLMLASLAVLVAILLAKLGK